MHYASRRLLFVIDLTPEISLQKLQNSYPRDHLRWFDNKPLGFEVFMLDEWEVLSPLQRGRPKVDWAGPTKVMPSLAKLKPLGPMHWFHVWSQLFKGSLHSLYQAREKWVTLAYHVIVSDSDKHCVFFLFLFFWSNDNVGIVGKTW